MEHGDGSIPASATHVIQNIVFSAIIWACWLAYGPSTAQAMPQRQHYPSYRAWAESRAMQNVYERVYIVDDIRAYRVCDAHLTSR